MELDCLYGVWGENLSKLVIQTSNAPKAIGTYSQGIQSKDLVFTSGQIPIDPKTGELIIGDFKAEVYQVLTNLDGVLRGGGSSLQSAVKLSVFLIDLSYFAQVNEIFNSFFLKDPPARSALQVSALPMNARIEIEAIGYVE